MYNGANLAYLGDAYLELKIREYLLLQNITSNKKLKTLSLKYVSAKVHPKIYLFIEPFLTPEEQNIYLRGRNASHFNHRKNLDLYSYQVSSGLEAICGYLYLKGDIERLDFIISKIIEGGNSEC